ncbi:hypothetical protein GOBAR_AA14399 [Gossypium barbadense]|uniref:Uncharacterized protein n=1 Tax=Gossypium barbadense TaxID=3634 RepID=A0A2P5XSD2_GOSBA|nr:hypothetical protein GOBAR_AA14399 [Gossypium barbadense]
MVDLTSNVRKVHECSNYPVETDGREAQDYMARYEEVYANGAKHSWYEEITCLTNTDEQPERAFIANPSTVLISAQGDRYGLLPTLAL